GLGELAQAPIEVLSATQGRPQTTQQDAPQQDSPQQKGTQQQEEALPPAQADAEAAAQDEVQARGVLLPEPVLRITRRGASRTAASLRSRGDLPQRAYEAATAKQGEESALVKRTRAVLFDFEKGVHQAYGQRYADLDTDTRAQLDEALRSSFEEVDDLPGPVRRPLIAMRRHAEALSRRLVRAGVLDQEAEAALDANGAALIRPRYRAGSDPEWIASIPDDVKNRARALLASKYPDRNPAEVEGLMTAILQGEESSPLRHLTASRAPARKLRLAASFVPESNLRALLGNKADARVSYAAAMTELGSLVAERDFFDQVRETGSRDGAGRFLFEQPTEGPDGTLYATPVDDLGQGVGAPLAGLYTTPEIAQALGEVESPSASRIPALVLQATAATKYAKTVLSPLTQVRNVVGNLGFAVMQGHLGRGTPKAAREAIVATWNELRQGKGATAKRRAYAERLTRLGVIDESVRAGDLAGIFRDAGLIDRADATRLSTTSSRTKQAVRASLDVATRLYQSGDAAWKVYAFEMERGRYARVLPDASDATLDRIAARIVRDTYPTYSKVPEAIQKLRRLPVLGPFVSFPAEVLRTTYHTLRLVRDDLADPRRRQIGLRRAAGVLAQGAITGAATTGALALSGLTEDDERDVRRLAPRWDRNGLLTVWKEPVKDENGRPTGRSRLRYTNLSYSDPHAMLREPVLAVVRRMEARRASVTREGTVGEPMSDADLLRLALDAATPLLDPFLSEDILAGRMIDVLRNRDEYGRAVYDAD
ncbi:MAG: hypothetical protein AAGN64_11115, partial [Bacteroidota bacterium]